MPANDGSVTAPPPGTRAVRDTVLAAIARGALRPGDAVATAELVRRTGAGPDAVADALEDLVELGVARRDGAGTVIAHPTHAEMADTDEVRHILEEVAVRRFVAQATATQVEALRRAVEDLERIAGEPEPSIERLVWARDRFFVVMLRGTAGMATGDLLRDLRAHAGLVMSIAVAGPGRPRAIVAELRTIYRALARRDAGAAVAACDRHRRNCTTAGLERLRLP